MAHKTLNSTLFNNVLAINPPAQGGNGFPLLPGFDFDHNLPLVESESDFFESEIGVKPQALIQGNPA